MPSSPAEGWMVEGASRLTEFFSRCLQDNSLSPHLLSNEPHNEGISHCESSLFNNEGIVAHCSNNEPNNEHPREILGDNISLGDA